MKKLGRILTEVLFHLAVILGLIAIILNILFLTLK
jgi:hypothetical protein